jgi:hypothetical protein
MGPMESPNHSAPSPCVPGRNAPAVAEISVPDAALRGRGGRRGG